MIRAGGGTGHLLFNKEGVTQGDPLAMVDYGLGILPLIHELWQSHPSVIQPWYADDAGAGSAFEGIRRRMDDFMVRGTLRGYFTEPTKSILVVSPWSVPQAEDFFRSYRLQVVTGSRYLGGFVVTNMAQDRWLGEKVEGWWDLVQGGSLSPIDLIRGPIEVPTAVVRLPATRYPGHRYERPSGGGCTAENLPPGRLSGSHGTYPGREIISLLVKQARISLRNPTRTTGAN